MAYGRRILISSKSTFRFTFQHIKPSFRVRDCRQVSILIMLITLKWRNIRGVIHVLGGFAFGIFSASSQSSSRLLQSDLWNRPIAVE